MSDAKSNDPSVLGRRRRRKPEEAKALILDAARKVFAEIGPDRAGLKAVAKQAGVSHGLITHYFGTFDALVEETLRSHSHELTRELIAAIASSNASPEVIISLVLERLADPKFGRLVSWALLSGRFQHADFFPRKERGPKAVADALEAALSARAGQPVDRNELETLMVLVWCAAVGYSMSRHTLWEFYGRVHTEERDRQFLEMTVELARRKLGLEKPSDS